MSVMFLKTGKLMFLGMIGCEAFEVCFVLVLFIATKGTNGLEAGMAMIFVVLARAWGLEIVAFRRDG